MANFKLELKREDVPTIMKALQLESLSRGYLPKDQDLLHYVIRQMRNYLDHPDPIPIKVTLLAVDGVTVEDLKKTESD